MVLQFVTHYYLSIVRLNNLLPNPFLSLISYLKVFLIDFFFKIHHLQKL